jgi:hypothetical protein
VRSRLTRSERILAKNLSRLVQDQASCSVCGRSYRENDISFTGHRRDSWLYVATCGHCGAVAIFGALTGGGVCRVRELARGSGPVPEPVTREDVARLRHTLQDFDGDFARLFATGGEERS